MGTDALSNSVGADNAPVISTKNSSTVTISSLANAQMDRAKLAVPVSMTVADAVRAANGDPADLNISIHDSAANVAGNLTSLAGLLALGHLDSINLTDSSNPVFSFSKADLGAGLSGDANPNLSVLGKIATPYSLDVSGLTVQDGLTLKPPSNAATLSLSLSDSADNVANNLAALETVSQTASIKNITLVNSPANLSKPVLATSEASFEKFNVILSKIKSDYDLTITDVPAKDAISTVGAADKILKSSGSLSTMSSVAVSDTTDLVLQSISTVALAETAGRLKNVTLSDKGNVTLSYPQLDASKDILSSLPAAADRTSTLLQPDQAIAFVDAHLDDASTLLRDLAGRGVTAYLIDPDEDGLGRIASVLSGYHDLSAVHIFSHGQSGLLQLGSGTVGQADLVSHAAQMQTIGQAMSQSGDILLYGCDVASGSAGQAFVSALAKATDADIAASLDKTGALKLGGNWTLEVNAGAVEASSVTEDIIDQKTNENLGSEEVLLGEVVVKRVTEKVSYAEAIDKLEDKPKAGDIIRRK